MSSRKTGVARERTPLEWTLLGVSVLAIVAVAGALTFYGLSGTSDPPDLHVSVRPQDAAWVIEVENKGGTTAEEVLVEVERRGERREVEFKAVAKGDTEEATLTMRGDGKPTARVIAFKEP